MDRTRIENARMENARIGIWISIIDVIRYVPILVFTFPVSFCSAFLALSVLVFSENSQIRPFSLRPKGGGGVSKFEHL